MHVRAALTTMPECPKAVDFVAYCKENMAHTGKSVWIWQENPSFENWFCPSHF